MKFKVLGFLVCLGFISAQAHAVGSLGSYSCLNSANVSAVYTAETGAGRGSSWGAGYMKNVQKASPQGGCYYGETIAGSDGARPAKCFFAFVKKASQTNYGSTRDDYTASQCVYHGSPDTVVTAGVKIQSMKLYWNILQPGDFEGAFDKDLAGNYGVGVCLDKTSDKTMAGYGDYAFCELLSTSKDGSGKRERIATINFQMTPGVTSVGGGTAEQVIPATGGDAQAPAANPDAAGSKLKKKFGF